MSFFTLNQTKTALSPGLTASFLATDGFAPFTYTVVPNGAGGTIDPVSGVYTAPAAVSSDPEKLYDTIRVIDANGNTQDARILVGNALLLFCEVIEHELSLPQGRAFLWNQKIFQPTDTGLYVAVSVPSCRPFSNITKAGDNGWDSSVQITNFYAQLDLNIMSRDTSALFRKEEVIMALNSIYAQKQQEGNSFYIGKLPPGAQFTNLSSIDGAAIPYRYQISVSLQYATTKTSSIDYFDTFQTTQLTVNS